MAHELNHLTGFNTPTHKYDQSVISAFPRINKKYLVESSIGSRNDRDYMSTNCSLFTGRVTDQFIEFNVAGVDSEFIDLSSIAIEMKLTLTNADGTAIANDANLTVCDGIFHRIFQSHTVYMNSVQVENSPNFGLLNVIKTYCNMSKTKLATFGRNMGYNSLYEPIPSTYTAAHYAGLEDGSEEHENLRLCRTSNMHFYGPLNLDVGDCDTYLLDKIDLRIRLDLAPPALVLNTSGNDLYKYHFEMCKLWIQRVTPIPSAMLALNRSMNEKHATVEYIFNRPVLKRYIFPRDHTSLIIDNPFQGIVPQKIFIFTMNQTAFDGQYSANPNYLITNNITNVKAELNGSVLTNMSCSYPDNIAQAFYETVKSLGANSHHLITYENFKAGRNIYVFDTRSSDAQDVIYIERSASLRFSLNASIPCTSNKVVFLLGYTTGVFEIGHLRRVFPQYLQ